MSRHLLFGATYLWSFLLLLAGSSHTALAEQQPYHFKDKPTRLEAKANTDFSVRFRDLIVDPNYPKPIEWKVTGQPGWLQYDKSDQGRLYGRPTANDTGTFEFQMGNTVEDGGVMKHPTILTVLGPPSWKVDPSGRVDLGIQTEGELWSFDLKTVVSDPNGNALTFSAKNLPQWMRLDPATGILSGTPLRADVAKYDNIELTAHGKGGDSVATAYGEVRIKYKPAKWVAKEITIDDAYEDQSYQRNLTEYVLKADGTIAYDLVTVSSPPPPWLEIGKASGVLFGTPKKPHIGPVSVTVQLKTTLPDGQIHEDVATFKFNVIHVNHPPEWASATIKLPDAYTKADYQQDLSKSASDYDGDKLLFDIVSYTGPQGAGNWVTIDKDTGMFKGTPDNSHIGLNTWVVRVSDPGGLTDTTTVEVNVLKSNEPPYWVNKPTVLPNAKEDFSYQVNLNAPEYVIDPDNDQLYFEKLDGPAWLNLSQSGLLTGKPEASDVNLHKFQVKVSDRKSGSDTTYVQVLVDHTNHNPKWILDPMIFSVKEDLPMSISIKGYATDPDKNDTLIFTPLEIKPWASLSQDGVLTGTPTIADEGENRFRVRVTDNHGAFADAVVIINVLHVNHKPYWTKDLIELPDATEDVTYSQSLTDYGKDPDPQDQGKLRFVKLSGPAWANVTADGMIQGTPARKDIGTFDYKVRILDPMNEFADATVRITVQKVNKPPRWRQNPITLTDATEDTLWTFDVSSYAVDDDNDPLTFSKVSGPDWISIDASGKLSGTPVKADVGPFVVTVRVSDGQLIAVPDAEGKGTVKPKNHPPVISPELAKAFEILEDEVSRIELSKYVTDSDGDELHFFLVEDPGWVTMTVAGVIEARPVYKHIGEHTIKFKVDDSKVAVNGEFKLKVIRNPSPPVWLEDPIRMEAQTNIAFTESVKRYAKDLDDVPLTFSKKLGKDWLTIGSDGSLSGMPTDPDIGDNEFKVEACNDGKCSTATLIIKVKPGVQIDVTQIDTDATDAKAELLWVVDSSRICDPLIRSLKRNINVFYDALRGIDPSDREITRASMRPKPQIKHTGVYLSSDAHKWDGLPIRDGGAGPILMKWDDTNWIGDFNRRTDSALAYEASCDYSSPIWSMYRFYQRVVDVNDKVSQEIYHKGYMEPQVPMDVLIVTQQMDHYKWFTKNIPELKNYTANEFANDFIAFHNKEKKAYRISAIAPECPSLYEMVGDPGTVEVERGNAYRILVQKTKGRYYTTGCDFNMADTLKDYANMIRLRASIHTKNRVKLSKTPNPVSSIRVFVGDIEMTDEKWDYDSPANEVILYWNLIDQGQLKPGDKIRIEYRVS